MNGRAGDWRQTAITPITVSRAISGATISRSSTSCLGPRDRRRPAGPPRRCSRSRARRSAADAADDALAEQDRVGRISSAIAPRATIAWNDRPSGSARYTALVSPSSRDASARSIWSRTAVEVERRGDLAGDVGQGRHLVGAPPRLAVAAGRSGSRCRRWRRSSRAAATSAGPNRPSASRLWTLITPIALVADEDRAPRGTT